MERDWLLGLCSLLSPENKVRTARLTQGSTPRNGKGTWEVDTGHSIKGADLTGKEGSEAELRPLGARSRALQGAAGEPGCCHLHLPAGDTAAGSWR